MKKAKKASQGGQSAQDAEALQKAVAEMQAATQNAASVFAQAEKALADERARAAAQPSQPPPVAVRGARTQDAPPAGAAEAPMPSQSSPQTVTGSLSQLEVSFPTHTAPPPAFASVCVVHRFPEYLLIDFGSIDPLQVEANPGGGQKAMLQHVGRICLPETTAKRLLVELAGIFGVAQDGDGGGAGQG